MNGVNGSNGNAENSKPETNAQILQALEIVHNPRSDNALRQGASQYLEQIRSDEEAPYHGFGLASGKGQSPIVRFYGLSLIEYGVRQKWSNYTPDQSKAIRDWVITLALNILPEDPPYIANKVAEIWVEIAKRSWGIDWMDMDEVLVRTWNGEIVQRLLVLTILETLSEAVFGNDDTTVALRGNDLNRACVDIFTPADVLTEQFPTRETMVAVRHGAEGWLTRMAALLEWCISGNAIDEKQQTCAVKTLYTFKSVIMWVIPKALVSTQSVNRICACLAVSNIPVQLVRIPLALKMCNRALISRV